MDIRFDSARVSDFSSPISTLDRNDSHHRVDIEDKKHAQHIIALNHLQHILENSSKSINITTLIRLSNQILGALQQINSAQRAKGSQTIFELHLKNADMLREIAKTRAHSGWAGLVGVSIVGITTFGLPRLLDILRLPRIALPLTQENFFAVSRIIEGLYKMNFDYLLIDKEYQQKVTEALISANQHIQDELAKGVDILSQFRRDTVQHTIPDINNADLQAISSSIRA